MRRVIALLIMGLATCLPAGADTADEAFLAGQFMEAARKAEASGGADNLAKAARCILADGMVRGTTTAQQLDEAEKLARAALAAEPRHIEGRLQLAITLSMKTRNMSTREAMDSGYGSDAVDLVKSVLEDDPTNSYAHGFMAVWNVEVVRRGGSIGSAIMGASMDNAREHYAAAIQTYPVDPSVHWQYARALAALNARKYGDNVEILLERAITGEANGALAKAMQARANTFLAFVGTHSNREIERMAQSLL